MDPARSSHHVVSRRIEMEGKSWYSPPMLYPFSVSALLSSVVMYYKIVKVTNQRRGMMIKDDIVCLYYVSIR